MSLEKKIKDLLARSGDKADVDLLEEESAQPMGAAGVSKDQSIPAKVAGDVTQPMQGSSAQAEYEERDEDEENQGAVVSKSVTKNDLQAQGAGAAPNYQDVGDATSVVNMPASKGNVAMESVDVKAELATIFGEDLSEDFRNKASSIFEAAVVARVNSEIESIVEQLEAQKAQEINEAKEGLVEKVDAFMNYVVEQWMEENTLAVDNGLRTEITEDFITGLKTLFAEHYIEVPEEKYDVLGEMQSKIEELESKLNETISESVELNAQLVDLKKAQILEEQTRDLADTEAEKLQKLIEGVEFDNEQLFAEKVAVIKENYFPKASATSTKQHLTEDVTETAQPMSHDVMSKYVQSLSRSIKSR